MISPIPLDLDFLQGASFAYILLYQDKDTQTPIDLTGYTARMHIRAEIGDEDPLFTLTTENGGITLQANSETGRIDLYIAATDTAAVNMDHSKQRWVYDLELMDASDFVTRAVEGNILASPEVTRQ